VNKIVDWGRRVAALLSAVLGLYSLAMLVFPLAISKRLDGAMALAVISVGVMAWLPPLVCAWGILKVRAWAYVLAMMTTALAVPDLVFGGFRGMRATAVGGCLIVAWLLLPPVRGEYWRRERVA